MTATQDIQKLGTILGIWAHPDDETFMVGGILSMAAASSQVVACVTATKGEAGVQDESKWPAETLGQTRAAEIVSALEILGISNHHWLDYRDGTCGDVADEEVIPRLAALIEQYKPDTIITFPPDGLTGHPDHQAVSRWARAAAKASARPVKVYFAVNTQESYDSFLQVADQELDIYFAIDKPVLIPEADCDVLVHLAPEFATKKAMALKAMTSQTSKMFDFLGDKGVEAALGTEALINIETASAIYTDFALEPDWVHLRESQRSRT